MLRDRAVRRQPGGEREFAGRLIDRTITGTGRRGKFLWLSLDDESTLLIHLGMSGQLIVPGPDTPPSPHVRAVLELDAAVELWRARRYAHDALALAHGDGLR